ncbi:hypothetical protein OTU49_016517, partial [Cherax quadricarinatus]
MRLTTHLVFTALLGASLAVQLNYLAPTNGLNGNGGNGNGGYTNGNGGNGNGNGGYRNGNGNGNGGYANGNGGHTNGNGGFNGNGGYTNGNGNGGQINGNGGYTNGIGLNGNGAAANGYTNGNGFTNGNGAYSNGIGYVNGGINGNGVTNGNGYANGGYSNGVANGNGLEDPITALANAIRGEPGVDYPILAYVPDTGFTCSGQIPGYYADTALEAGCQVFHICQADGRSDSFLCPNGTIFNQQYFVCDWWYNFDCSTAQQFYGLNAQIGVVSGNGNGYSN